MKLIFLPTMLLLLVAQPFGGCTFEYGTTSLSVFEMLYIFYVRYHS